MSEPAFDFGDNWREFSQARLDPERLARARDSLCALLGEEGLRDCSFLDVGCGSGIFAISAAQCGATRVVGVDVNPTCIDVSRENAARFPQDAGGSMPCFEPGNALNREEMDRLGHFDVVYAWGSLHHTGRMWQAIENTAACVNPCGGRLMLAIYNRHWSSRAWHAIKYVYNVSPRPVRAAMVRVLGGVILVAKRIACPRSPREKERGMDFWFDVVDWVGGYPYEVATREEIVRFVEPFGFRLVKFVPPSAPTGCNEFVFERLPTTREPAPHLAMDARPGAPSATPAGSTGFDYDHGWQDQWDDMKRYGPMSRHIRRLINTVIRPLEFTSVLDVGCGQGSFLMGLMQDYPDMTPMGVDLSAAAVDMAAQRVPSGTFRVLDVERDSLDMQADLVVCSEVLEHIPDDEAAMRHIAAMTAGHLVVTTLQGRMRAWEADVMGHVRNYARGELVDKLRRNGFEIVRVVEWGFPFYSPLYRALLGSTGSKGTTGAFGPGRKALSALLYWVFLLNSWRRGDEIVVVARPARRSS